MNPERSNKPYPFNSLESAGDAYIAHGFLEEAKEVLTAAVDAAEDPFRKSQLEMKRLTLPFHYIHNALNTLEASERHEVETDIEASYGLMGEQLEDELTKLYEVRDALRRAKKQRGEPVEEHLKRLGNHKGRVSEITFQALAAREYTYMDAPAFYAVPTTEAIDKVGKTRASDLQFFLPAASDATPTAEITVFSQVKTSTEGMMLANLERVERGLSPLEYDDDIAMLVFNDSTKRHTDFKTGELLLPRAIIRELQGTNTPEDDALIAEAAQYTRRQITDIAAQGLATVIFKKNVGTKQKMPEQVGA